MKKEKDFFKTCFDTVARLEVKNESQAIAKEVVLDEIENLQQELTDYKERNEKAVEYIKNNTRPEYRNGRDNEFYLELNQKELNELLEILDKKDKE